jgi:hypothetical protein
MKLAPLKVHARLFAMLALSFVIATIISTVSHEAGHCAVAKALGYDVTLHYASMNHSSYLKEHDLENYYNKHINKMISKEPSPERTRFTQLYATGKKESILIILGGPLQTYITGSIAMLWLWYHRKKMFLKGYLTTKDWFVVIIAFFWSRAVITELICIYYYFVERRLLKGGDEAKISHYLGLPVNSLNTIMGIIGALFLLWVTFCIVPKQQRFTFILAGIAGSALGAAIWFLWIGPLILP